MEVEYFRVDLDLKFFKTNFKPFRYDIPGYRYYQLLQMLTSLTSPFQNFSPSTLELLLVVKTTQKVT